MTNEAFLEEVQRTARYFGTLWNVREEVVSVQYHFQGKCEMPVIRSGYKTNYLIAYLMAVVLQEQKGKVESIDWHDVWTRLWFAMDENQRLSMLHKEEMH